MTTEDSQIHEKLRAGDESALAEFLGSHEVRLLAFIRKRTGSHLEKKLEPEDILQEASMEAVRSLGSVDLSERDPLNWLLQICER